MNGIPPFWTQNPETNKKSLYTLMVLCQIGDYSQRFLNYILPHLFLTIFSLKLTQPR